MPSSSRRNQKPWPLKWVALIIFACLALYTFVTLHFRRRDPSYQPYHDTKERITLSRLESAGYQRIYASAQRPAEPKSAAAALPGPFSEITAAPGGLDSELKQTLIDSPQLPTQCTDIHAPREAQALLPYSFQFTCSFLNNKQLLSGTYVYLKDQSIMIVPDFEKISGDLLARTPVSVVQVTLPAGTLSAGTFHATLIGSEKSMHWDIQVH